MTAAASADALARKRRAVAPSLDAILAHFAPGSKITVIVRTAGSPAPDFVMSNDDDLAAPRKVLDRAVAAAGPVVGRA